jgi:hypothetical protein
MSEESKSDAGGAQIWRTLAISVIASLLTVVSTQMWQTHRDEQSWRRQQHIQNLQTAVDKALASTDAVEKLVSLTPALLNSIQEEVKINIALRHALRELKEGRLHAPPKELDASKTQAQELFERRNLLSTQLEMLLFQAQPLALRKNSDPNPLDSLHEYEVAWTKVATIYLDAIKVGGPEEDLEAMEAALRPARNGQEAAERRLHEAVLRFCMTAITRLQFAQEFDALPPSEDPALASAEHGAADAK